MADRDSFVINSFPFIWRESASDTIVHLADAGYRRFEILLTAPHLWPADFGTEERRKLNGLLRERKLEIVSVNPGGFDNNLASPAADVRRFAQDYISEVIRLSGELGVSSIVMSPGVARPLLPPSKTDLLGWLGEGFDRLIPEAERAGVRLCLENIPFTFLPRAEQIMYALDKLAGPDVGIVYDVANAVFAGEDPCTGLRTVAPRLDLMHLSDTTWKDWRHDPVGQGVVPFEAIHRTIDAIGYEGPVALEIITDNPDLDLPESIATLDALGW